MEQILIVDDDPDFAGLLANRLKANGYKTLEAYSGNEGLKLVREKSPDLILLDIIMPELDGIEVTNILKSDAKTAAIPIIMLTGQGDRSELVSSSLVAGAVDYITKPFDSKVLLEKIRTTLSCG